MLREKLDEAGAALLEGGGPKGGGKPKGWMLEDIVVCDVVFGGVGMSLYSRKHQRESLSSGW